MYNRILVPIDNPETLSAVMTQVVSISSGWKDCTITLFHVEIPVYNTTIGTGVVPVGTGVMPVGTGVMSVGTGVMSVGTGVVPLSDNLEERSEPEGHLFWDQATHWLGAYNIEPRVVLKWGDPANEICKYAEEDHTDLIIVGKRDKGLLEKLFLGSVSQKVVQNAPCHVLVLK